MIEIIVVFIASTVLTDLSIAAAITGLFIIGTFIASLIVVTFEKFYG